MDIAGLAFNPLFLAVADYKIRYKEKYKTCNGCNDGNAYHERKQVPRGVFLEVLDNIQAVADRHAFEFTQKVELDRGGVNNLATDIITRGVE